MKTKTFILTNPADYNVLKNLSLGQHVYLKKSESDGNQKIVVNTTLNNSKVEIGEFSSHRIDEFFEFINDNSEGIITSIIDSSLDFHEKKLILRYPLRLIQNGLMQLKLLMKSELTITIHL